ncbi:DUF7692 domain-containing protein [Halarchaeum salinum]|uniref:DUF7692 domain-containing protein n=1 Tax=Halarchaeum salinum TaxID=489912 RepID=A0AAV3S957_9EURY
MAKSFRMDTSGDKAHREDLLEDAMDRFDESTKSGAVVAALDFSRQIETALERASEHPDMTEELADVLSTSHFEVVHEVERDLRTPRD